MLMCDLIQESASGTCIPAWPPDWIGTGVEDVAALPDRHDGVLSAIERIHGTGEIGLTMILDGEPYTGRLTWDGPPMSSVVERLLQAHVGSPIGVLGALTLVPLL